MKRHKICGPINDITRLSVCFMKEDPNGEWVKWEDIRPLFAEYMNPFELAGFIESLTEEFLMGKI